MRIKRYIGRDPRDLTRDIGREQVLGDGFARNTVVRLAHAASDSCQHILDLKPISTPQLFRVE